MRRRGNNFSVGQRVLYRSDRAVFEREIFGKEIRGVAAGAFRPARENRKIVQREGSESSDRARASAMSILSTAVFVNAPSRMGPSMR